MVSISTDCRKGQVQYQSLFSFLLVVVEVLCVAAPRGCSVSGDYCVAVNHKT